MPDRFFSEQPLAGEAAVLTGGEAHHLLHVMRAQPGLEITLFDGSGGEWLGLVSQLDRTAVTVQLLEYRPIERELDCEVTLAVVLPKGDRQRWLIEKCVELGLTRLVPLITERSNKASAEPPKKLERYVVEASKQCGRNRLMQITATEGWPAFAMACATPVKVAAHPGGVKLPTTDGRGPDAITIAIGPEGGFTDTEMQLGRNHGWEVVGLGVRILRIETAALALLARLTA